MSLSRAQRELLVAEYYSRKLYLFCKKSQHEIFNYKPPVSQSNDDARVALLGYVRIIVFSAYNDVISLINLENEKPYKIYRIILSESNFTDEHQFDTLSSYSVFNFIIRFYSILESGNRTFFNQPSFVNYLNQFEDRLLSGFEILRAFRNTIHNNGKYHPTNGHPFNKSIYSYTITINPGDTFTADIRLIYHCAKASIELFKKIAFNDLDERPFLVPSDPQYRMY